MTDGADRLRAFLRDTADTESDRREDMAAALRVGAKMLESEDACPFDPPWEHATVDEVCAVNYGADRCADYLRALADELEGKDE